MKNMLPSNQIEAAIKQHLAGMAYSLVVLISLLLGYYFVVGLLTAVSIMCSGIVLYKLYKLYKNPMLYLANLEALTGKD